MRKSVSSMVMLLLASGAVSASAEPIRTVLTFDELPFQSVDGLGFKEVTFDFKVDGIDSTDAFFGSFGPGTLATIDDPSLTGNSAGILTMDFSGPTDVLEFGVALSVGDPLLPGFFVELFDVDSQSLGKIPVNTETAVGALGFSEGAFVYSGQPIVRATVDFADSPGSFALDNLVHAVPEPPTGVLCLAALLLSIAFASNASWKLTPPRPSPQDEMLTEH